MPSKQFQARLLFCLEQVQKGLKSQFSQGKPHLTKNTGFKKYFVEKFNHKRVCGAAYIHITTHMYMHTHVCLVFQLNWDKRNQRFYIFHLSKKNLLPKCFVSGNVCVESHRDIYLQVTSV